jgi:shikimate kinase
MQPFTLPSSCRIYLVGMPASGKSTLGQSLARKLSLQFKDLDEVIVSMTGKSIPQLFSTLGEAYFRKAEREALQQTLQLEKTVIATGGGTPCFFDNMDFINHNGLSIWAQASLEELEGRLNKALTQRPMFAGKSPAQIREILRQLLENRLPYYQQAQLHVATHAFPELLFHLTEKLKALEP